MSSLPINRNRSRNTARNVRNRLKLQRIRDRVQSGLRTFAERRAAFQSWWQRRFQAPVAVANWWSMQSYSAWLMLLGFVGMNGQHLARSRNADGSGSNGHRAFSLARRRRMRIEPLEERRVGVERQSRSNPQCSFAYFLDVGWTKMEIGNVK